MILQGSTQMCVWDSAGYSGTETCFLYAYMEHIRVKHIKVWPYAAASCCSPKVLSFLSVAQVGEQVMRVVLGDDVGEDTT